MNFKDKFSTRLIKVNTRRLDTILASIGNLERLDVLALDVEGWELECLRGFSFGNLAPKVAIIENYFNSSELIKFMNERGYVLWGRFDPNEVYCLAMSNQ